MQADLYAWEPHESHSMLGLQWHPGIYCSTRAVEARTIMKRIILSQTAQLFDTLGWLAPVLVRAKILIQSIWLQDLD